MTPFVRSDEYQTKIFLDAFENNVVLDARIEIHCRPRSSVMKAYCPKTGTNIQFPRSLRKPGAKFIADVIQSKRKSGTIFYRAYRGSIRNAKTGELVG